MRLHPLIARLVVSSCVGVLLTLVLMGVMAAPHLAARAPEGAPSAELQPADGQRPDWRRGQLAAVSAGDALSATVLLPIVHTKAEIYLPIAERASNLRLEAPRSGETRRSLNAYLTWEYRGAPPGTLYSILLEPFDPSPDVAVAWNLQKRSFDPATFMTNTVYFWQVLAWQDGSLLERGPVWSFSTDYFPAAPELDAMVSVPEGEFLMGCDTANAGIYRCMDNEVPLHPVYISSFEIDKFEVTNVEYRGCVAAGACNPPRKFGTHRDIPYYDNPVYDNYPVLFTSNQDARNFCAWEGKRLPTEAEWEKAARGTIDTRPWPWGNEPFDCTRANTEYCTGNPQPVDSFVRNQSPYGAVNMSGNVHEWVQDFYLDDYYEWSPYRDPLNTRSQRWPYYSARGGDYRPNWWYSRTTNRNAGHHGDDDGSDDRPLYRSFRVGFRCARSLTGDLVSLQLPPTED